MHKYAYYALTGHCDSFTVPDQPVREHDGATARRRVTVASHWHESLARRSPGHRDGRRGRNSAEFPSHRDWHWNFKCVET
jgi:hypothetical protein